MSNYMKTALLIVALVAGASANDGSKQAIVKFSAPVEAPGVILPAGNYVFRLAADESNRNLVEIFTEDDDEPIVTLSTIPASRSSVTEGAALMFEQKPDGRPEAIRQFFYPGEVDGFEFVYEAQPASEEQPLNIVVIPLPDEDAAEPIAESRN
jgi:hypothetical protein